MALGPKILKLSYPDPRSFCEEYKKRVKVGKLFVPSKKAHSLDEILDLFLIVPELDEPFEIRARVVSSEPIEPEGSFGLTLELIDPEKRKLSSLEKKLSEVEIYREALGLGKAKKPSVEVIVEEEEPEVVYKESVEDKELLAGKPEFSQKEGKRVQFTKLEEQDAISRLREWLEPEPKEDEKKPRDEKVYKPEVLEVKRDVLEKLEPVSKFIQSMVKAMLRTGYYSPEHPGSKEAKRGLYQEFMSAIGGSRELNLSLQSTPGGVVEIMVGGVSAEPISLRKLLGVGTSELFVPKYLEYFERKRLVFLSIRNDISESHFEKFIDIMSDPTVDQGQKGEVGGVLTTQLVEAGIKEISTLFEDDLVAIDVKLPWRVEMAIHRLAKDLRVIPLYKGLGEDELKRLKVQTVEDIIRPLGQPHLLKDIVLNCHLISRRVKEIDKRELESAIVESFPMPLLLQTSKFIFEEMEKLNRLLDDAGDAREKVEQRIKEVKEILKLVSLRVVEEGVEGGDDFLESLYMNDVLTFEQLPSRVKERVKLIQMVMDFQKRAQYYLSRFLGASNPEEYQLFLRYFQKLIPELLGRGDYQGVYLVVNAVNQAQQREKTLKRYWSGELGDELDFIISSSARLRIKEGLSSARSEAIIRGMEELLKEMGAKGIEILLETTLGTQDKTVQKRLIQIMERAGEKIIVQLRALLDDPARSKRDHIIALQVLGRIGEKNEDKKRIIKFLSSSYPELREEALSAVVRLEGRESEPWVVRFLDDPDARVRRRAIAICQMLFQHNKSLLPKLIEIMENEEEEISVRAQAIKTLSLGELDEKSREELEESLTKLLQRKVGIKERLKKALVGKEEEGEHLRISAIEALSRVGGEKSIKLLQELSEAREAEVRSKALEALQKIRLRLQD